MSRKYGGQAGPPAQQRAAGRCTAKAGSEPSSAAAGPVHGRDRQPAGADVPARGKADGDRHPDGDARPASTTSGNHRLAA